MRRPIALSLPVLGLPVLSLPVLGLPVVGLPVLGLPVLGLPVLGLLVLAFAAGAVGAEPAAPNEDADACQTDIHRLCDRFFPDPKLVATCLVDRRSDLSQACAEVLARPDPNAPKLTNRAE